MLPWHVAAGAGIVALVSFGGGWQVRGWKAGADDRDRAELVAQDVREQAVAQRGASEQLATDLNNIAGRGLRLQGEVHADLSRQVLECPKLSGDAVVPGSLGRLLNDIDADDAPGPAR